MFILCAKFIHIIVRFATMMKIGRPKEYGASWVMDAAKEPCTGDTIIDLNSSTNSYISAYFYST